MLQPPDVDPDHLPPNKHPNITLKFVVEDTGSGIDPEAIPNLFQPFNQADSSTARLHEATGLGLSISQQLVKMMDGRIELSSQVNLGTQVTFIIPFQLDGIPRHPTHPMAAANGNHISDQNQHAHLSHRPTIRKNPSATKPGGSDTKHHILIVETSKLQPSYPTPA